MVHCAGGRLDKLFKSTPKNITYKSKTTYNEVIDICGDFLKKELQTRPAKLNSFSKFLDLYQDDLPQPRFLDTELEMWSEQCQMEKTININARISLQEQMSSNKWLIFTGQQKKKH